MSATGTILLTCDEPPLRAALAHAPLVVATDPLTLDDAARASVRVMTIGGDETIGAAVFDALPNLRLIVAISAGYDRVDVAAMAARGIALVNGSGLNADDVADFAVGLFLGAARRIVTGDAQVRGGGWRDLARPVRSIGSYAVGIVGMGAIGRAIAARLAPFRCTLAWTGPHAKPAVAVPYAPDLMTLARGSDALIVAAPLTAASAGMIDAAVLDALGPRGLLVNVGRGGLVDEDALIAALRDRRLGGAALDVFVDEPTPPERWRDVPNTLLSPHTAGVTYQALQAMIATAVARATDFLAEHEKAPPSA